ncbi:terminase small subunit [Enterococcus gilvus]|uniref:terminase small subunit n=1 Tax=Enterococcus gilvus TaxID=160453 RepID=UPI003D6BE2E7
MEKRELAFKLYKKSNGQKPLIEIAKEIDASPGTVRGWKSRYKWDEALGTKIRETQRSVTRNVAKFETSKLVIDNDNLTEQQKMFCLFYLQHFNATKAYQQAYDVDYKSANANGSRLLVNASVKEELHKLKRELQQDTFVTAKDLVKEYVKQAFSDITDFTEFGNQTRVETELDENMKPVPVLDPETGEPITYLTTFVALKNSDEVDGTLIQEVKKVKDGVSVKLYDKQKAMSELMKYLGGDALREAQLSKITGNDGTTDDQETWKQAVISAANKRAVKEDE